MSRLMVWRSQSAGRFHGHEFLRLYTEPASGNTSTAGMRKRARWRRNLDRHLDADLSFDVFNRHHFDGVPGTAIQERAVGALAGAFLAANAQERVDFDASEGRVFIVGDPVH